MNAEREKLVRILERALAEPKQLKAHIDSFLRVYWEANDRLGEEWLPYGSPGDEALHDLGSDLQDYEPPGPSQEPSLIHDAEALKRISNALSLLRQ